MDFGGQGDQYFLLCEFTYNNIYYSYIDMAFFKHCKEGHVDQKLVGLMLLSRILRHQYAIGVNGKSKVYQREIGSLLESTKRVFKQ